MDALSDDDDPDARAAEMLAGAAPRSKGKRISEKAAGRALSNSASQLFSPIPFTASQQQALPGVSAQAIQQGLIGDHGIQLSQEKQERQRLRRQVDRARLKNERLRAAAGTEPEAGALEKTVEQLKLVAGNPCNPLRCEVCNIGISGPKALDDHVQGKWHKRALALAESGGLAPGQVPRPRRFANAKTKPSQIRSQKAAFNCHFWAAGNCRNGAGCPYRHEQADGSEAKDQEGLGAIHPEAMLRKVAGSVVHALLDDNTEASSS